MAITNLTVFTDASFCPFTKAGGGAFWSRYEDLKVKESFPLTDVANPSEAELVTAVHALHRLYHYQSLRESLLYGTKTRVVLVVDCYYVKRAFEGKQVVANPIIRANLESILQAKVKDDWALKVNHVPAHTNNTDARTWVNSWCDREAKKHMRKERKLRQKK
jgi:ribonuclease HI